MTGRVTRAPFPAAPRPRTLVDDSEPALAQGRLQEWNGAKCLTLAHFLRQNLRGSRLRSESTEEVRGGQRRPPAARI